MAYRVFHAVSLGASDINFSSLNTLDGSIHECSGVFQLHNYTKDLASDNRIWKSTANKHTIKCCVQGEAVIGIVETNADTGAPTKVKVKKYDTGTDTVTETIDVEVTAETDLSTLNKTSQYWVNYKDTSVAAITVADSDKLTQVIYTRYPSADKVSDSASTKHWNSAANDAITVSLAENANLGYAWRANDGSIVYTRTDIPVIGYTSVYKTSYFSAVAISNYSISEYIPPARAIAATSSTSGYNSDPIAATWESKAADQLITLSYTARVTSIAKAAPGKEIATVVTELFNPTKIDANVTLIRYAQDGTEAFSYTIGLSPTEVLAIDHKYLLPEGYSLAISATVAGVKICVNAIESAVLL